MFKSALVGDLLVHWRVLVLEATRQCAYHTSALDGVQLLGLADSVP